MEDLRIYDFSLNLLHIENKIISSNWQIYYNDIGKAEIHLPVYVDCLPLLFKNKYLIITQGKKQAIVTAKQIGTSLILYGKTPNWILTKRLLSPFYREASNVETTLRELFSGCFYDCEDFILGSCSGLTDTCEFKEESCVTAFEVIKSALSPFGAGHRVYFDIPNKKWVFEITKGTERNIEISVSLNTAYDMEYVYDIQDSFSCAKYKKAPENSDDEAVWIEISQDDKSGIYRWETVLYETNETDAKRALKKCITKEEITSKVKNLVWETDYFLGDTLNVRFERGSLKEKGKLLVVGIRYWDEAGASGIEPIFNM